jgi:hypothetical protein
MSTNPKGRALIMHAARGAQRPRCRAAAFGSLDRVKRVVRLGVSVATSGDVREQPKVADALRICCETSSEKTRVLVVVWSRKPSARHPVELEVIFKITG